jgi:drug/metabolite transporter (DMT)-like permease
MAASTLPLGLVFRLALAVILDTAVHIVWKLAVLQLPDPASLSTALEAASREPLFLLVAALFVWQLINWLRVLEGCDLSYSQPITALSLILVLILSALYLGESVDALKLLGIGFVFAGVWFISRTDHDSSARSTIRQ